MIRYVSTGLPTVAAAVLMALPAVAQDSFLGQQEFVERCSVCHGAEGKGDGIVGELFAQKPKNLRVLASENSGVFPFAAVYESIDGQRDVAAHGGDSQMPVWGDYLIAEALERRNIDPKDAQLIVEARILALVQYIQSLQVN